MYDQTEKPRDLRRAESQASGHAIPGASAPPKPSSLLDATKEELGDAMKRLVDLNGRLTALADRVFGSQPETSGMPAGNVTESFGVAAEIEGRVNGIHALIQAAHYTAARLERI